MASTVPPSEALVECCYCGFIQMTEAPPTLHTCGRCRRDFRVLWNVRGGGSMKISDEARKHFAKKTVKERV